MFPGQGGRQVQKRKGSSSTAAEAAPTAGGISRPELVTKQGLLKKSLSLGRDKLAQLDGLDAERARSATSTSTNPAFGSAGVHRSGVRRPRFAHSAESADRPYASGNHLSLDAEEGISPVHSMSGETSHQLHLPGARSLGPTSTSARGFAPRTVNAAGGQPHNGDELRRAASSEQWNTKAVGLEQARTGPSAKPTKRRQLKSSLSIGASASGAYHVRSSNAYSVASVAASDAPPAQNGTADDSLQSRHGGGAGMITRKHRVQRRGESVQRGTANSYASGPVVSKGRGLPVLDPRSKFMRNWDVVVVVIIFYTAFITPFEVSFIMRSDFDSALFIANRVVDFLFAFDVLVNFNLMYFDSEMGWVTRRSLICRNYLRSFAIVDLASTVPYDVIVDGETGSLSRLKALRLIKLLRMFRSARVISRLADQFFFHYSYLTLFNFGMGTILLSHWLACLFHMVKDMAADDCNWLDLYYHNQRGTGQICADANVSMLSAYLAALYWAGMTISTVGYGDVVPNNNIERVFVIASLLVGTSFFSYIVGSVCGVLAKLGERNTEFQDKMSELNVFIRDANIGQNLAARLRGFFRYQHNVGKEGNWADILQELTPALRGAVAMEMHSGWLKEIRVFAEAPDQLIIRLTLAFSPKSMPPEETLVRMNEYPKELFVLQKGLVIVGSICYSSFVVRGPGEMIADELFYSELEADYGAMTLTYVDLHSIDWAVLVGIINDSTEFVCGPFEKYRRWRSVLNKLRTLFRAIKRVREQYAKLATQCWEERGLRIETSEGARMAPLSTLLVRTGKNQELKRAAAASLEHNNVEDEDVRLSLTSPYGQGDDVSQLKHRMGGMRGSLRRGRDYVIPTRLFFSSDWILPPKATVLAIEKALPVHWNLITDAATFIQRAWRQHMTVREASRPAFLLRGQNSFLPATSAGFAGPFRPLPPLVVENRDSAANTPREGSSAAGGPLFRMVENRLAAQNRLMQKMHMTLVAVQGELSQLREASGLSAVATPASAALAQQYSDGALLGRTASGGLASPRLSLSASASPEAGLLGDGPFAEGMSGAASPFRIDACNL